MGKDTKETMQKECYRFIVKYAKEVYEGEERRENSIIEQAGRMQAAFSFVIAALFMLAQIIIEHTTLSFPFLLLSLSSVSLSLLSSLLLATLAQRRVRRVLFPSVKVFREQVIDHYGSFETTAQRDKYMATIYEKMAASHEDANNKRVKLIRTSMLLFFVALALCLFWFIIGMLNCLGVI